MMKRIDTIERLTQRCTGCMACVDVCPTHCITSVIGKDGFRYASIDVTKCIECGKCYNVCPLENQKKNLDEQHLFAAYAMDPMSQNCGSSGGIFGLLAEYFMGQGYHICGAAFEGTTLRHRIVHTQEEIKPLLKSKYVQSDTEGIFASVLALLKNGERVFFCGTPCQVSALINITPNALQKGLLTADIVCHGVPSQKLFDGYMQSLKKKHEGEILDFSFRVKDNRYKHAHGYSYKVKKRDKTVTVHGIYTNSSYYNAFKNYSIFREGCYDCQYATLQRVSDITLADFWGIEKYEFKGDVDVGVSMIITNTQKGSEAFSAIQERTVNEEFPLEYGVESNYCLTHSTKKPKNRDAIIREFADNGYEATAKKYFKSRFIHKLYWKIPARLRKAIRKIRGS